MRSALMQSRAQRIADAFRLEFETVWSRVRGKAAAPAQERRQSAPQSSAEKWILRAALQGKLTESALERVREEYFEDPGCKTIFSIIKNDLQAGKPIDFHEIQTHLRGEAEVTLLSELTLSEDIDDQTLQRIDENLRPMERHYLERRKLEIQREIMEAEKRGDVSRVAELDRDKLELSRMLNTLK